VNKSVFRVGVHVISGVGTALGLPSNFAFLGLFASSICFALHWKGLQSLSQSQVRWISFTWFFLIQLIQLSWMSSIDYQGIYILFVYGGLCAAIAAQFSFLTGRLLKIGRLTKRHVLFFSALWTLFEWIRLKVLCGFAFNFVGMFLGWSLFSLQVASLFGILGMSFWVMMTNLLGLRALQRGSLRNTVAWLCAIILPLGYGLMQVGYYDLMQNSSDKESCSVLLVQPGLSPAQKYLLPERKKEFIALGDQWERIFAEIALYKEKKVDLIVLPEAVVPLELNLEGIPLEWLKRNFVRFFGPASIAYFPEEASKNGLISNAFVLEMLGRYMQAEVLAGFDRKEGSCHYNSAAFFSPERKEVAHYDKRVLLPLAEYMPCRWLKSFSAWYGISDFFTPGTEAKVLGKFSCSPSICYDEFFSSVMRQGRLKGARLFVNVTNDGWYPFSSLPEQHLMHGLVRSVENGIPSIRACNTGVTSVVDGVGRVVSRLGNKEAAYQNFSGSLFSEVPLVERKTVFSLLGDAPVLIFSFAFVVICLGKNYSSLLFRVKFYFLKKAFSQRT
jgi:apolipoprotein N-acyltransferase